MIIGVICEGPTDYPAIEKFFGHALGERGIDTEFRALYPEIDQTRPSGGWANVLLWLKNNPPISRVQRYFGGGLFGGSLNTKPVDAILIHLDADVLDDISFINFVRKNYNLVFDPVVEPANRAQKIIEIISISAQLGSLVNADRDRHVPVAAVESTETWCTAACIGASGNLEELKGVDLTVAFMTALEHSEGRTLQANYVKIDKNFNRRKIFCDKHANGSRRIVTGCPQFSNALERLVSLK